MSSSITSPTDDINNDTQQSCIVYKFQSRPPFEGFILLLIIVVIVVLLLWFLHTRVLRVS
jgi:hypothetical protein|uniref:Uncharacterized protein n=1 Tax=viral metagenome TaxID=1070528 RepID=A0A6C0DYU3_9ZZZZ